MRALVEAELDRAVADLSPSAAVVVVLDPSNGRIIASAGRLGAKSAPELASERAWITGSTLKPFTLAAAFEAGVATPDTVVDCAPRSYGGVVLHDWKVNGKLSFRDVLAVSSNIGASRALDALGLAPLVAAFARLHLFDAPGRLPEVRDPTGIDAATLAAGELAPASPLHVAAAYAALFADGQYHAPSTKGDAPAEVALSPSTARTVVALLESAVSGDLGTGHAAQVNGHRVAGKTGTAELPGGRSYASFVGAIVDGAPRRVILVGLEGVPKGTGGGAAAPIFARIAARLVGAGR